MSSFLKYLKIKNVLRFAGVSLILSSSIAIQQINQELGTDILENQLIQIKEEWIKENKFVNSDNQLFYAMQHFEDSASIWKIRMEVYFFRLLHYYSYKENSQRVIEDLMKPMIESYSNNKIEEKQLKQILYDNSASIGKEQELQKIRKINLGILSKNNQLYLHFKKLQQIIKTNQIIHLSNKELLAERINTIYHLNLQIEKLNIEKLIKEHQGHPQNEIKQFDVKPNTVKSYPKRQNSIEKYTILMNSFKSYEENIQANDFMEKLLFL